jgi:hypothetical protein
MPKVKCKLHVLSSIWVLISVKEKIIAINSSCFLKFIVGGQLYKYLLCRLKVILSLMSGFLDGHREQLGCKKSFDGKWLLTSGLFISEKSFIFSCVEIEQKKQIEKGREKERMKKMSKLRIRSKWKRVLTFREQNCLQRWN